MLPFDASYLMVGFIGSLPDDEGHTGSSKRQLMPASFIG
jgi:hypothetical protein